MMSQLLDTFVFDYHLYEVQHHLCVASHHLTIGKNHLAFLREEGGRRMPDGRRVRYISFAIVLDLRVLLHLRILLHPPTSGAPSRREP